MGDEVFDVQAGGSTMDVNYVIDAVRKIRDKGTIPEKDSTGEALYALVAEIERLRGEQKLDGAEIERLQRELGQMRDGLSITNTQVQNAACDAQYFEREVEQLSSEVERLRTLLANEQSAARENVTRLRAQAPSADYVSAAESRIKELSAEVERLRAQLAEVDELHKQTTKDHDWWEAEAGRMQETIDSLRTENAELRALAERVVGSSHLTSDTRRSTLDEVRARLVKPRAGK